MSSWHDTDLPPLTPIEAYDAMQEFLEAYWQRGGKASDDLAVLLGQISRNTAEDLPPIDRAQWQDWIAAVEAIKKRRRNK